MNTANMAIVSKSAPNHVSMTVMKSVERPMIRANVPRIESRSFHMLILFLPPMSVNM